MSVVSAIPQLRTTNIGESIDFYENQLGFEVTFRYQDFYAGIRAGKTEFHLKLVDDKDPSIDFVRQSEHLHLIFVVKDALGYASDLKARGVTFLAEPHDTEYSRNDFTVLDNQGHSLGFMEEVS